MKQKKYFFARQSEGWIMFISHDWDKMHRAWWWADKINFVLEELVRKHWKKWIEIFKEFNDALINASQNWKFNETGVIVLYSNSRAWYIEGEKKTV